MPCRLRFQTDNRTYVQGWRYRLAIKISTNRPYRFGPRLDYPTFGGSRIELTPDGAYVDFDVVAAEARRYEQGAYPVPPLRPLAAYNKAVDEAERQLARLMGELDRVVRESIASRSVSRAWQSWNDMDRADGFNVVNFDDRKPAIAAE